MFSFTCASLVLPAPGRRHHQPPRRPSPPRPLQQPPPITGAVLGRDNRRVLQARRLQDQEGGLQDLGRRGPARRRRRGRGGALRGRPRSHPLHQLAGAGPPRVQRGAGEAVAGGGERRKSGRGGCSTRFALQHYWGSISFFPSASGRRTESLAGACALPLPLHLLARRDGRNKGAGRVARHVGGYTVFFCWSSFVPFAAGRVARLPRLTLTGPTIAEEGAPAGLDRGGGGGGAGKEKGGTSERGRRPRALPCSCSAARKRLEQFLLWWVAQSRPRRRRGAQGPARAYVFRDHAHSPERDFARQSASCRERSSSPALAPPVLPSPWYGHTSPVVVSLYRQGFVLLFSGDTLFQVLEQGWQKMVSLGRKRQAQLL